MPEIERRRKKKKKEKKNLAFQEYTGTTDSVFNDSIDIAGRSLSVFHCLGIFCGNPTTRDAQEDGQPIISFTFILPEKANTMFIHYELETNHERTASYAIFESYFISIHERRT